MAKEKGKKEGDNNEGEKARQDFKKESDLEDYLSNTNVEKNESCKEMVYDEEQINECRFMPAEDPNSLVFYGTKHLYVFLRFFYTLYERFQKASEIANHFEVNSKTELLSQEEREALAKERYNTFKNILLTSLKSKEMNKHEDYMRSIFGKQAFLFITLDKVLNNTCKSLHSFVQDDLSNKVLSMFVSLAQFKRHSER